MTSDTLRRVIWTFAQAFVGAFAVSASGLGPSPNTGDLRAAGISAIIAGLAAAASLAKNTVFRPGHKAR